MNSNLKLGCSGVVRADTGIGVVQRRLYPTLETKGFALIPSRNRDLGQGILKSVAGLVRGFIPSRGGDVYLSAVPPVPFGVSVPLVTIVHDLRWLRTRSGIGRAYRAWDLRRTVRRSDHLLCISKRTFDDLVSFSPGSERKASVSWWGPGIMAGVNFDSAAQRTEVGLVLLVGGAAHKQNESAARLLERLSRETFKRVACVGVSDETISVLQRFLGPDEIERYSRISDEALQILYCRAEFFMLLSVDEGFGLPYIEALSAGCIVIAREQALTRELLGAAAILIEGDEPRELASSLSRFERPIESIRRQVAGQFDWDSVGSRIEEILTELAREGQSD